MPSRPQLPRHPVIHGHPLHAILSDVPAALVPAALVAEVSQAMMPSRETRYLSDVTTGAAIVGAAAAGIMGWVDWFTMPTEHPAHRSATLHGLVNSGGLLALTAAVTKRRHRLPLLGIATAAVGSGGWIGGDLVFRHGWRVRPAEEGEIVESELAEAGLRSYFDRAREQVSAFERDKTFLGG